MCGICGVVDWSEAGKASILVARMTPTMQHRGPDDEGYFQDGALAFGMRRLSIIDLTTGQQPVFNEDRSVAAIVNGEIYNFRELKDRLWDRGHTFSTRSDSEVVTHAYEEWGADCVYYLEGMFALAIYDRRHRRDPHERGTLFLARDRLGIKPLYYYQDADRFAFASEVRTLLASGIVSRRLSRPALQSYLQFGSVNEPMTLVEGVFSLPPGHRLTIQLGSQASAGRMESYWNIADASKTGDSSTESASRVRELLEESVHKHLIADVPVGLFLSGGIDSTALAALASRQQPGIHSFTVTFPEAEFNEGGIARQTAEHLKTSHSEFMLSSAQMLERLDEAVGALDQPSIDGVNTYFVSWAASQTGLKVAISGLGGDEIFGGYNTFRRTPQYQRVAAIGSRVPESLRTAIAAAVAGAGEGLAPGDAARKIASLWNQPQALPDPYYFSRALFAPPEVAELMTNPETREEQLPWWNWLSESAEQARKLDAFAAVSCMEIRSYLVNTLLRDADCMSMAHSLELRVPFLDHSLVEFVTQLPETTKLRKGVPKALLVRALAGLLPPGVVNQKKRGFTFPWEQWLRGALRPVIERGLSEVSPCLQGMIETKNVARVWRNYLEGHTSWSRPWSLYVLNRWTTRHLDCQI